MHSIIPAESSSYFPHSFVLIFAPEPSEATSITQAPFRFSTSLRPFRCIAVRHPCFDFTTEGGKRIFNINESKHPTRRGTGARRLLCESQAIAIHRGATLRPAHNRWAPTRVPTSLRRGNTVFKPKTKTRKRKERHKWKDTANHHQTFRNGQPC